MYDTYTHLANPLVLTLRFNFPSLSLSKLSLLPLTNHILTFQSRGVFTHLKNKNKKKSLIFHITNLYTLFLHFPARRVGKRVIFMIDNRNIGGRGK